MMMGLPVSRNDHRPRRREEMVHQHLDREAILYDPAMGTTYRLNETAYFIWQACDGRHSVCGIAARLAGCFDVDQDAAEGDVRAAIEQMSTEGLLAASPGTL